MDIYEQQTNEDLLVFVKKQGALDKSTENITRIAPVICHVGKSNDEGFKEKRGHKFRTFFFRQDQRDLL